MSEQNPITPELTTSSNNRQTERNTPEATFREYDLTTYADIIAPMVYDQLPQEFRQELEALYARHIFPSEIWDGKPGDWLHRHRVTILLDPLWLTETVRAVRVAEEVKKLKFFRDALDFIWEAYEFDSDDEYEPLMLAEVVKSIQRIAKQHVSRAAQEFFQVRSIPLALNVCPNWAFGCTRTDESVQLEVAEMQEIIQGNKQKELDKILNAGRGDDEVMADYKEGRFQNKPRAR